MEAEILRSKFPVAIPRAIYRANDTSKMYFANSELIGAAFSKSGAAYDSNVDAEVNAYECANWACVQAYQVTMTASKQCRSLYLAICVDNKDMSIRSYQNSSNASKKQE